MEPQYPGFFLLPLELKGMILSHLGSMKGKDLNGLLNLRGVSKSVKNVFDELGIVEGKRIFRRCQAKVELKTEALEKFIDCPSPEHVTSLHLAVSDDSLIEDTNLLEKFLAFWAFRLESLEVNQLQLPLSPELKKLFMNSSSLHQLKCHVMSCRSKNSFADLFNCKLKKLCVGTWKIKKEHSSQELKHNFYLNLRNSITLQAVDLETNDQADLEGITELLEARKDDLEFKIKLRNPLDNDLCFNLDINCGHDRSISSGVLPRYPVQCWENEKFREFIHSLTNSKSQIELHGWKEQMIYDALKTLAGDYQSVEKFQKSIMSISSVGLFDSLELQEFQNLVRVEISEPDEDFKFNCQPVESVKSLVLYVSSSITRLFSLLQSLNVTFPTVESLTVKWKFDQGEELDTIQTNPVHAELWSWKCLKSLDFTEHCPHLMQCPGTTKNSKLDLFNALGIQLLSLESLKLDIKTKFAQCPITYHKLFSTVSFKPDFYFKLMLRSPNLHSWLTHFCRKMSLKEDGITTDTGSCAAYMYLQKCCSQLCKLGG